jgi:hypothetical protein
VNLIVALQDILLLQDWISVRLTKPNLWSVKQIVVPVSTLYGRTLYGVSPYSSIKMIPWQTARAKPTNGGWKSFNELQGHI